MTDLPKEGLDGSDAFEVTGTDFSGPYFYNLLRTTSVLRSLDFHLDSARI